MRSAALLAALLCFGAVTVTAQSISPGDSGEPLGKRISIQLRDAPLRDALDRVALLASIRISYSGDNLPLDRRVSLTRDTTTVAEVLDELLRTYTVHPVVVARDHIVLAQRAAVASDTTSRSVAVLDRVVVTGNVIGAPARPLPIALDIVRGRDVERRVESKLASVFDGAVPGIWLWEQTPTAMLARYGSIRGASSFGLSFPKVYIDGIEVANPLLLTHITPEIVERIEVIRGPQGAALYGSDAISGVVNVITRHEGAAADGGRAMVRSSAGYTASAFTATPVAVQEHVVGLRAGSNLRSAGVTIGGSTSGEYIPHAYSHELRGVADARVIGARSTLTASGRVYAKNAGVPESPLLVALKPERFRADSDAQELRTYSVGSTLTIAPSERWSYALTAGLDGYSLTNVSNELSPIPSAADTALRDASGAANRGTARASAVTTVGTPEQVATTFSFALEHSVLHDQTLAELSPTQTSGSGGGPGRAIGLVTGWSSNTGLSAQTNLAVHDAAYVTTGIRVERIRQAVGPSQLEALPMLGAAVVHDFSRTTIKLRGAYGRGIRAPRSSMHIATREPRRTLRNDNLHPEEQSGIEAGADVMVGRHVGFHFTHFDQTASGLIQTVTIADTNSGTSGPGKAMYWYQLQNVGEITNRGFEAQASFALASVTLGSTATWVDSRVRRLARGYTGDLRPGDRMLAVPSRTVSGTASWMRGGLHLSSTVARAFDWINYDRLRIAECMISGCVDSQKMTGSKLRDFWVRYPGSTRLRTAMSYEVRRGLILTATGENLLNHQTGEPDSITIVPGRTISAGLKLRF